MNQRENRERRRQEPNPTADSRAGQRPPSHVIVHWASEELRQRIERNNAALAQDLKSRDERRPSRMAAPTAELEAEP